MSDKRTVARGLEEIARHLEVGQSNKFKARAYANAARVVESLDEDIHRWIESGGMERAAGIGKTTASIIRELAATGRSAYLDELRSQQPAALFDLTRVPGLRKTQIALLHETLGIASVKDLEKAARSGELAQVRGFGPKAVEKIVKGLARLEDEGVRFLLPEGMALANELCAALERLPGVERAAVAGSIRRRLETVEGVTLVAATGRLAAARKGVASLPHLEELLESPSGIFEAKGRRGVPVRIVLVAPDSFGAALLVATGSGTFAEAMEGLAKGSKLALRPDGLFRGRTPVDTPEERDVFTHLGVAYVEPELREETSPRPKEKRPRLVSRDDLRGIFHVHTTWSDGRNTVREMLDASRERGFDYVGLSDHSKAAFYAHGLSEEEVTRQQAEIGRARRAVAPMVVFKGTEADILADGTIDYGSEVLKKFDFVVASIHSRFGMAKDEMTRRVVTALSNPFVTFLGHPTGRLLLSRDGYQLDFDAVFDAAAEHGVIIEINGSPRRLDLDWRLMQRAVDRGVMLAIHPDAHSTGELDYVISGCFHARKGALHPRHVFNTKGVEEVTEYLGKRKKAAIR